MKRLITVVLTISLVLIAVSALAAGKISVLQENFYAIDSYTDYSYVFAKVGNVGNKVIKVNAGILEVFDKEGDNITSSDYLSSYAENLEPDEYTYISMNAKLEDGQLENVDDYLLTITGKSETDYYTKRLTVKDIDFKRNVQTSRYSTNDRGYFTIVNDTEDPIWNIRIVYAILDDEDNILYVDSDYIGTNKGLAPGSSIFVTEDISSTFVKHYDANGLNPTKIDVIAYVDVAKED